MIFPVTLCCSVRPSGSESLPGVEIHDVDAYEDVSTCVVTDFPVMDTIPEHASTASQCFSLSLNAIIVSCFPTEFILFFFGRHGH